MKVTIVTVYDAKTADTHVSAVLGEPTLEEKEVIVKNLRLRIHDGESDVAGFRTVEVGGTFPETGALNAFPEDASWDANGKCPPSFD